MENKTNALIFAAVVLIMLVIAIIFKIKSDKKRKSTAIFVEGIEHKKFDKNAPQIKKPNLWGIPSWGLALLTMISAFIVLMVVSDILAAIFKIPESNSVDLVFYILYNLIIAGGCFYICLKNPKSILYVPILCNIIGIISAIVERTFWTGPLWIVICGGWALSVIASLVGASIGKRGLISDKSQTN